MGYLGCNVSFIEILWNFSKGFNFVPKYRPLYVIVKMTILQILAFSCHLGYPSHSSLLHYFTIIWSCICILFVCCFLHFHWGFFTPTFVVFIIISIILSCCFSAAFGLLYFDYLWLFHMTQTCFSCLLFSKFSVKSLVMTKCLLVHKTLTQFWFLYEVIVLINCSLF